jgi:hypothetical protein
MILLIVTQILASVNYQAYKKAIEELLEIYFHLKLELQKLNF